jgi:hypothetical protein
VYYALTKLPGSTGQKHLPGLEFNSRRQIRLWKGGTQMPLVIERVPHRATLGFKSEGGDNKIVQTFGSVNPRLTRQQVDFIQETVNMVRRSTEPTRGGYYTIMDELTVASA